MSPLPAPAHRAHQARPGRRTRPFRPVHPVRRIRRVRRAAPAVGLAASAALLAAGCSSTTHAAADTRTPAHLTVNGGYIPQPLLTDLAVAYVTVTNSGGSPAALTAVSTPLAAHVSLHTTTDMTMRQVTSLPVPAHGRLTLATGGDHLMLENLVRKPAVGDTVPLTLHFTGATPTTMTVTVPVRPTTYTPKG